MFNRKRDNQEYAAQVADALEAHGLDVMKLTPHQTERAAALMVFDTDPDTIAHAVLDLVKRDNVAYPTRLLTEHWSPVDGTLPSQAVIDLPLCLN